MSEQQATQPVTGEKTTLSVKEAIAYLAQKFPLCFSVTGEAKPLKVGLFQDLAEAMADDATLSKTQLRQVLRAYTLSWRYLQSCSKNALRVDLNGAPAGLVDEEQAKHAAENLAAGKAAVAERKAQQRKEERKEQRKEFFKQQAREQQVKKRADRPDNAFKAKKPPRPEGKDLKAEGKQAVGKTQKSTKPAETLSPLAAELVKKGQAVKVKVGSSAQPATILAVEKAVARVQLQSGLTMNVNVEHLFA